MYTILMLNQKGGVGKTTIADELSFALERRGKTVAFVTTDPQGGSVHEVCDDPDFAEECDFQVVDTAGVLVGGVNDWCRAANLILVPMLPSTRDMEPTLRTLDIVRESGTGAKAYVIVNNFMPTAHSTVSSWSILRARRFPSSRRFPAPLPSHVPQQPVCPWRSTTRRAMWSPRLSCLQIRF